MPEIPLGTAIALLGAAFAAWAWVVAWGVTTIRSEVHSIKLQVADVAARQYQQMLDVEHRLTAVETDIRRCALFGDNHHAP